ncbi:MAG: metallophosphoesterase [Deltaproteobacteria bacterium]|nr:metallophosphoesterase [Deltaproteobacteria bacterium]
MVLFISTFTLVYGLLHGYFLWKARRAFAFTSTLRWVVGPFILIMIFAPFLVRLLERWGYELPAQALGYAGFTWMGFLFLLLSASLVEDGYRLAVRAAEFVMRRRLRSWVFPRRRTFLALALLAAGITFYGYLEALGIRSEHVTIMTSKLPSGVGRFRIVQISDVHLGLMIREGRLRRILEKVHDAKPDMLVSTGDLVDSQMDNLTPLADMFREIAPRHGKFAITGNHEFYAGLDRSLAFMHRAGFTILRGEAREITPWLTIAGVDDPAGSRHGAEGGMPEKELLSKVPPGHFTLLLKHRPFVDDLSHRSWDLQLSGHTHKGQIFPFSLVMKLMYPIDAGLLALPGGSSLYVSRGAGTWGPPIRFLAPPEVTVIELVGYASS